MCSKWMLFFTFMLLTCCSPTGKACKQVSDCCLVSPSALCSTEGFCESNPFCAQDANCWIYRWGACGETGTGPVSDAGVVKEVVSSQQCRTFKSGVGIQNNLNQCGGNRGQQTSFDMSQINEFWGSSMYACPCSEAVAMCKNNAYATSQTPGYIYYDPNLFASWLSSGSKLPAAWATSHEAGHNLQFALGMSPTFSIQRELSADCFSGFFLAWLQCKNMVNQNDISATLSAVCMEGDSSSVPWFQPGAHGNCNQRINAVANGMKGYMNGALASNVCNY